MTYLPLTMLAVIATGAACAGSIVANGNDDPSLRCELDISSVGRTVTITAGAQSDTRVEGEYQLDIHQQSLGGQSTIRQSGDFVLDPGTKSILGEASFTGKRVNFDAELVLTSRGKNEKCTSAGL